MAVNVEMPLHKARELMAPYRNAMPINNPLPEIDNEPPKTPNVLVDAVSLGGASDNRQKPLVRHVLVKDLNKIGMRMKLEHPKTGVFQNKAPMGLYGLFDGQSGAGEPGPMAAEFCARNFHIKLLKRLSELGSNETEPPHIQGVLDRVFEDLDTELLNNQPEVNDGCGAAVALLIGETIFTAVIGQCCATLCSAEAAARFSPVTLGNRQGVVEADVVRIRFAGGIVLGEGLDLRVRHPLGVETTVSRSLGDRMWKEGLKLPLILCLPEVHSFALRSPDYHPFLILSASTVSSSLTPQELVEIGGEYLRQPRATCGEIVSRAMGSQVGAAQCTALEVCFLPHRTTDGRKRSAGAAGPEGPPSYSKKAKIVNAPGGGTQSMRLRHILVKFQDRTEKDGGLGGKTGSRSRQEAETILRKALLDFRRDALGLKRTPKDAMELVRMTTDKFSEICKKISECESAKKGGTMCGDLGWLSPEDLAAMGGSFKEVVEVLMPGHFSDITTTEQGMHLVQRVA